jgi:hypothetical protein
MSTQAPFRIAVLDDYQNVALTMADWSVLDGRASVTVFNDHLAEPDAVVARLQPFDIVCVMRERTPLTRAIIERLPRLKLIASTDPPATPPSTWGPRPSGVSRLRTRGTRHAPPSR